MTSYSIKKRRASPDDEPPLEQVLQNTSYSLPIGVPISQRYIPEQQSIDLDCLSENEGYLSFHEVERSIQAAVKSGYPESSLIKLVRAECQQQEQYQQQQHRRAKRLQQQSPPKSKRPQQQEYPHQHQQHLSKRPRFLHRDHQPPESEQQYYLSLQQRSQNQDQPPYQQQLYQEQLYQHQVYQPPPYQQPPYALPSEPKDQQSYRTHFEPQYQQPYQQQPELQEQHCPPQRLHLNTNIQMPAKYPSDLSHGDEKSSLGFYSSPDSNDGCSPGWTTARVVRKWLCFETEPGYDPMPTTKETYEYDGATPVMNASISLVAPASISPGQPNSFACDGGLMAQDMAQALYLPNWTPLQPSRAPEVLAPTSKEEMFYPNASPNAPHETGIDLEPPVENYHAGYFSDTPVKSESISGPAATGQSIFAQQEGISCLSLPFDPAQYFGAYDVKEEPGNLARQGASAASETYSRPVAAKRGPFKDHDQRVKTALTRKMGSCIRCRMQRIRCVLDMDNTNGPCIACKKLFENSANIYRPSCARLKITDMKIFKPGQVRGFEWTNRWKDSVLDEIDTWQSVEIRMIKVTEGYTGKAITLAVRKFKPQEGDKLARTWVSGNGEKRQVVVPPYAIVDMEAAARSIRRYIRMGIEPCFESLLGSRDNLIYKTYLLAMQRSRDPSPFVTAAEKKLLVNTLDLWFTIRLSTKSFEIVGEDLLDMPRNIINDESNDLHGRIPIPPVLGAQLDSILLHQILAQYRRIVLEDLSKMVHEKKPSTWLTTYLATFILLHNAALITRHDACYAKKHGMDRRFARPAEVKEYNVAAQTILHYYHYCNKGIYPFTAECKDFELRTLAELDGHGIEMVHYTRQSAAEHKSYWESLWAGDEYENEYYYLSQLYEAGWQARSMA